jgi:hypothetical protein
MRDLLELIHTFLALTAMCSGITVSIRLVSGELFEDWALHFLKYSLAASALGILLSLNQVALSTWITALGVYVSGFAVLASRRLQVAETWLSAFAMGTLFALFLDSIILVLYIVGLFASCGALIPAPALVLPVTAFALIPPFAVISTISLKRLHRNATPVISTM